MKKYLLLTAALLTMALTSCDMDHGDEHETVTYTYTDCFYQIKDLTTGTVTRSTDAGMSVQFTYTYDKDKVVTTISLGIKGVPSGLGTTTVQFNDLSASVTPQQTILVEKADIRPDNVSGMTVNQLRMEWLFRSFKDNPIPVAQLKMKIDDRYELLMIPRNFYLFGPSVIKTDKAAPYTNDQMWYQVTVNPNDMKASVFVHEAKFAEAMPRAMDMNFPDADFTLIEDKDGKVSYKVSAESIIPTIDQVPYPAFEIQNLSGAGTLDGYMKLGYTVKGMGTVTANLAPAQPLVKD